MFYFLKDKSNKNKTVHTKKTPKLLCNTVNSSSYNFVH